MYCVPTSAPDRSAPGPVRGDAIGRKHGGTWLIEHSDALAYLTTRWRCE